MNNEKRYRVEAVWYSGSLTPNLSMREYEIIRKTPKGFWIYEGNVERFVLDEGRKRFAVETRDEALSDFRARKRAQIRILTANFNRATSELQEAVDHGTSGTVRVRNFATTGPRFEEFLKS